MKSEGWKEGFLSFLCHGRSSTCDITLVGAEPRRLRLESSNMNAAEFDMNAFVDPSMWRGEVHSNRAVGRS